MENLCSKSSPCWCEIYLEIHLLEVISCIGCCFAINLYQKLIDVFWLLAISRTVPFPGLQGYFWTYPGPKISPSGYCWSSDSYCEGGEDQSDHLLPAPLHEIWRGFDGKMGWNKVKALVTSWIHRKIGVHFFGINASTFPTNMELEKGPFGD